MRLRRKPASAAFLVALGGIAALLLLQPSVLERLPMASASGSEATIKAFPHWVVSSSDISQADGVVIAFVCFPGGEEACPPTVGVTVTVKDGAGDPLGSVSAAGVGVPGGQFFDLSPDVPIAPIESIAVEVTSP